MQASIALFSRNFIFGIHRPLSNCIGKKKQNKELVGRGGGPGEKKGSGDRLLHMSLSHPQKISLGHIRL